LAAARVEDRRQRSGGSEQHEREGCRPEQLRRSERHQGHQVPAASVGALGPRISVRSAVSLQAWQPGAAGAAGAARAARAGSRTGWQ
jgi:hypothetical protein